MDLLHISFDGKLPTVLKPRQPYGYDEWGSKREEAGLERVDSLYTEHLPPRVSFAPTIQQCILAIWANVHMVFANAPKLQDIHMFVYEGIPNSKTKYLSDTVLKEGLWDYHITNEVAVTSPINVKLLARILITNPFDKNMDIPEDLEIYTRAYNDPKNELKFLGPKVEYRILQQYYKKAFK